MKIVIIDNTNRWLKISKDIASEITKETLGIEILSFKGYNQKLRNLIFDGTPKLYIIDFELGDINGNDIANEIRQDAFDWKSIIIMFSIYDRQESIISERLCIYTYISKKEKKFNSNLKISIKSALNILSSNKFIDIKENRQNYQIPINEITEVNKEKLTKYCIVKTINKDKFRVRSSLTELNKKLNFKRTNNYTLINPNLVNRIKYQTKEKS